METFDQIFSRNDELRSIDNTIYFAEGNIKNIFGVSDAEILPDGNGGYRAHVELTLDANRDTVTEMVEEAVKDCDWINDIKVWVFPFPRWPTGDCNCSKMLMIK